MKAFSCSLIAAVLVLCCAGAADAAALNLRAGAYDFTDDSTRDFYGTSPALILSAVFYDDSPVSLEVNAGGVFTVVDYTVNYSRRKHYFFMLPLQVSFLVNFRNQDSVLLPYLGAGIGAYYKYDRSPSAHRSYHYVTYGYHLLAGLQVRLSESISLVLDIRYNFCMTNSIEEIDLSGINPSLGISYRFGI